LKRTAYGKPIFIGKNATIQLEQIGTFDEKFIQELVFNHSEALPIDEIDDTYSPLIPVCTELQTPVGPLDVLLVTPSGRLCVVETKLWRNPEARRKVVAQILDYAKELSTWDYGDLQREVNRRIGGSGNALYRIACGSDAENAPPEAAFVDAVSRNLRRGRFLLLLVGDGIREGAARIAEFLTTAGHLEFGFGVVELAVYAHEDAGTVVTPRVIARTVELTRVIVEVADGMEIREAPAIDGLTDETELQRKRRHFFTEFWRELISELEFDDPDQPLPALPTSTNLFLSLPVADAWISGYFMSSSQRVGVYFRTGNTPAGRNLADRLQDHREVITEKLGPDTELFVGENFGNVGVRFPCDDVFAPEHRGEIKQFFRTWLNTFVNVFRPILKSIDR